MKRIWITGYRSYELGIFNDQDPKVAVLQYALANRIKAEVDDGATWILTGAQMGIEQLTAMATKSVKTDYPDVHVAVMLPFQNLGDQWNETNQAKLQTVMAEADFSGTVRHQPYVGPVQLQNYQQFMLQHSEKAILVYDPEFEGKPRYDYQAIQHYQTNHEYSMDLVTMADLAEDADQYQELKYEEEFKNSADQ